MYKSLADDEKFDLKILIKPMRKVIFILLLLPLTSFGQLGEYWSSKGNIKAKGLTFQIRVPLGFEQRDADRPNIVQKWLKDGTDNSKIVQVMVAVKYLPEEVQGFGKNEWTQYLKYEGGIDDYAEEWKQLGSAENEKFIKLDSYPGFYIDGFSEGRRLDLVLKVYYYNISVFVDNYYFNIYMSSPEKSVLESNYSLFLRLSNSIIFSGQYN